MKTATRRAWRLSLRVLRTECPTLLPVRVRLIRPPSDYFGRTCISRDAGHFNVNVYRYLREDDGTVRAVTRQELLESLSHEWAHAIAWANGHCDLEAHDPLWGVAYSRCYQAVCED